MTKKLLIFGASGRTGVHLVQQALDAGHSVRAFVRTPSRLALTHDRLDVFQGDVQNAEQVAAAMAGIDAVLSVLGPSENKPVFAISTGIEHILAAMQQHGVTRLIQSAGAGVRDPNDRPGPFDRVIGVLLHLLSRWVVADMTRVVETIRRSNTDWTVVRVPMLTDVPASGNLKIGWVGDTGPRLSRADLAAFMLAQLDNDQYHRQAPSISN